MSLSTYADDTPRFVPSQHLHSPPSALRKWSMTDIGYSSRTGLSNFAVCEPFPLFRPEAISHMRRELLHKDVWDNCRYGSSFAACQLRGFAPQFAQFIYEAWTHPAVMSIVSQVAGVDLVPNMDFEIAHVNISLPEDDPSRRGLKKLDESAMNTEQTLSAKEQTQDETLSAPVVGWHRDSFPFVCVLMLSDMTGAVGGETALKTARGSIIKVPSPQMGSCVVLQGRYIDHVALRALGSRERITIVTSYRPRDPDLPDDSVLQTVRPISDLDELYYQWSEYRMKIVEERLRRQKQRLTNQKRKTALVDVHSMKRFLLEQAAFLEHTANEMVPKEDQQSYRVKL